MIMHSNCFPARGIKYFRCVKCGTSGFNYSNGVDICSECLFKGDLCSICGKPMADEKPISSEENTNIEEDIYSKTYDIKTLLDVIPNITNDSKFKCSLQDSNVWEYNKINGTLLEVNKNMTLEEMYFLKDILEATYTIVKPVEEVKEKWVEITNEKDLCSAIVRGKTISTGNGFKYSNFNDKVIAHLYDLLKRRIFKIEYLEEN